MSIAEAAAPTFPAHPKLATVLFDESHSEAWTVRRDVAERMQPSHPGDSSLSLAANALADRDFEVAVHAEGALDESALERAAVLVIAHPSEPQWEATTGVGSPVFNPEELDAIESFVRAGGGLVVLGETEQAKYGSNLNDLLGRFGITLANATVQDYEHHHHAPSWVLADLPAAAPSAGSDLLARVDGACFYRAGALELRNGATAIARAHRTASHPGAPLLAVAEHGAGRVVACADSDLFGDDCIDELGHRELWQNIVYWAARPSFARADEPTRSPAAADPQWHALKAAVSELRELQNPDGSVDTDAHEPARLRELVDRIAMSAAALEPHFAHQHDYIEALAADLETWVDGGFAKPDFSRSIEAFRPEQRREDGIEHLVVFPMYKQNASPDTCFEALIVRVPWPEWIERIEAERYDNAKFLPVTFVDRTAGYDSECAVLFPETFAAAGRPEAHFGAIFCDREAERFRRVCGRAAELLELNLPPDAAALLASPELSRDAYILWDLVHDRTHMRGDLPFDPFMIRQRSPYWMYALEELRCDLTAFSEAARMEREGFRFARYAQYAIVFDRLFRFPVTGERKRNYDGLGGQLLFAYLHREGYLHWTDNRLTIDWNRLVEGVEGLRAEVQDLYHSGIDRSKLGQWIAAHDLVSRYVPAAEDSVWDSGHRDLPKVEEPKQLVDLVLPDEFPLSLFYAGLKPKLADALATPAS
ncbi:hypothetical protein HJD18_01625 [Thermoleophilia bacterium SCSIO 60948]|nr:hypothetical protein HJD18_01625 [Thermoleophilia bacterium SCSIO 60948]